VPEPGPGELRVRVEASELCGTDLHIASGEYPLALPGVTIGHEFAGTIAEVGPYTTNGVRVGDRVAVDPNVPRHGCSYCHNAPPSMRKSPEGIGVIRNGGLSTEDVVLECVVRVETMKYAAEAVRPGGRWCGSG
jgi:threonine dehydrogenase-like Zn-dependent dehydrogenase